MSKKCYRFFGGLLNTQEKWLNKMSEKGYRLVRTGKLLYEFEKCKPDEVTYCVEFIGEKSKESSIDYANFLEDMGYKVFFKNINLNYSVGKVRWRPWAERGGRIATNTTTFNREILIVEKANDGKPFELHTSYDDKEKYYRNLRNPSNPAVVSEIDGEVTMGKIKRGNREIIVTSKTGEVKKYLVALSKQILVQENDYVRAGTPLSDGATTPADILAIKGPTAVQEYIVNEVQDVYRLQGVKINDKHFEIIVRQMMRKVQIDEPGDTRFLEQQVVDKLEFMEENDRIWGKKVVVDAGDSQNMQPGQIVTARKLRDENSMLKRRDLKPVEVRDAVAATSTQILQGITRAALQTSSFMSAASFQETTKVLNEAAINGKTDKLEGMKENVICGHLIPAGTGQREFEKIIVGSKEEYDRILANKKTVLDYNEVE